jgi:hypothetical protein
VGTDHDGRRPLNCVSRIGYLRSSPKLMTARTVAFDFFDRPAPPCRSKRIVEPNAAANHLGVAMTDFTPYTPPSGAPSDL